MKKKQFTYEVISLKDDSYTKNNVYLIVDLKTKSTAIIDPACDLKQIKTIISELELKLQMILLTHSHFDHVRRVEELINLYKCNVFISRKEVLSYFFYSQNLNTFEDNDIMYLGNTKIHCMVTPGHTAGSACFLLKNSLFTGDTIFMEGCGICTGYGASAEKLYQSIQRIKEQIQDDVLVFPGHTYATLPGESISYLKNNNIYFSLKKEQFISFRMRKNNNTIFDFK